MKRGVVGVLVLLLMAGGVVWWLVKPGGGDTGGTTGGTTGQPNPTKVVKVTGTVGSEKKAFFEDPKVKEELRRQGLEVSAQSAGSWQMNDVKDDAATDFAFPASLPPAEAIQKARGITATPVRPFYSPLVVLAYKDTAEILRNNGLAARTDAKVWTLTTDKFIGALMEGRTWEQLAPQNRPSELAGKIYLTTTDPDTSSSGALYIAMASYLLNNKEAVQDEATAKRIGTNLHEPFNRQGGMQTSTDQPFTDFTSGTGRPLVLAYESQVLELAAGGNMPDNMVLLYPDTAVISDHSLVAFTDNGKKLADVLMKDDKLRQLAVDHGFRPAAPASGESPFKAHVATLNTPRNAFAFDPDVSHLPLVTLPRQEILLSLIKATK
ncbi:hypothetical protein ABTX81_13250 [Kitasatospora sp. NPDC097605]|uniref:hypothetical protein n=1 Tax=Kitasatospora sp. NPDC097605 TaxID=3157226 RepID=UPI003327B1B3